MPGDLSLLGLVISSICLAAPGRSFGGGLEDIGQIVETEGIGGGGDAAGVGSEEGIVLGTGGGERDGLFPGFLGIAKPLDVDGLARQMREALAVVGAAPRTAPPSLAEVTRA